MKKCILIHLAAWSLVTLGACSTAPEKADPIKDEIVEEVEKVRLDEPMMPIESKVSFDCTTEPTKEVTKNQGTISLPAKGFFVMESHYATRDDKFADKRLFPKDQKEGVKEHMARSCKYLKDNHLAVSEDCNEVYNDKYSTVWTPPENGKAGQAAVGDLKPTVEQEIWQGNIYWTGKGKPKPGTKYLVCRDGVKKCVVLSMGYEVGPGDKKWLGGVVREVHWVLGAKNGTVLTLGKLKDQSLPYGPVDCK